MERFTLKIKMEHGKKLGGVKMKVETLGLDVKIKKENYGHFDHVELNISNDSISEEINITFIMLGDGMKHTAEQFISALFDYDEDMAHKICEEYGNMKNLKERISELEDEIQDMIEG